MKVGDRVAVTGYSEVEYETAGIGSEGIVTCVFSDNLCEVSIDGRDKLNFWNTEIARIEDE